LREKTPQASASAFAQAQGRGRHGCFGFWKADDEVASSPN